MGMTYVQKLLARACGREAVETGEVLELPVGLAMSHENAALVINQFNEIYKDTGREARVWDPERIAIFAKGEYRTTVWDFVEFDCDQFLGELPLAVGMATLKSTDNDFFVSSGPNSNAYGFSAQGTLHDPVTGAPLRLSAVFRAIWDKEADEPIVKKSKVTLR